MKENEAKKGLIVRVNRKLRKETKGLLIEQCHLDVRKVGVVGTLIDFVPGHGGDVWWVKHANSDVVGAYMFDELDKL